MNRRGRRAALPPAGFQPQPRLREDQDTLVVRFVPEDSTSPARDFDFTTLPVSRPLQEALARAFAVRTKPSAPVRSESGAKAVFYRLSSFAQYLSRLVRPPVQARDLTAAQVEGWMLQRSHLRSATKELGVLKRTLRKVPGVSPEFVSAMTQSHKRQPAHPTTSSYDRDDFRRILAAARFDVRRAVERIRANRALLQEWRSGGIDQSQDKQRWRSGYLLDFVDRNADVPRYDTGGRKPLDWVSRRGRTKHHMTSLHLGCEDTAAFAVLLVGLTGENPGTITSAPAAHHRPDSYTSPIGSAIVELDKPRRGTRRHMDVLLVDVPGWVAPPSGEDTNERGRDDLHSAFGVYMLLHELTTPARRLSDTDRLLVWWASRSGDTDISPGWRTGLRSRHVKNWAGTHDLPQRRPARPAGRTAAADGQHDAQAGQLIVTLARLRLTFVELHQKPVAHTEATLVNDYLVRNRGAITDYQRVVADVLTREVNKARTHGALRTLTPADVEEARTDPKAVAARHGLDAATLKRLLSGELDTVVAGCTDNTNSPHAQAGQPCRASFMLCLSCPNARALPLHLPLQVAVHDALEAKRDAMTPLRWAQRFALPHAQLADLLERAGRAAVADARSSITADQHDLVHRFLNRELDLP